MKFIRKNSDRIFLFIVLFCLIGFLGLYVIDTLKKEGSNEVLKIDEISEYGYHLHENDSELFRNKFNELKILLNGEMDEEEYASLVGSLFVIDFYTLDNKLTNMDIGGLEYIHSSIKDNFILKSSDTIYKYIKNNMFGDRKQDLPIVSNVEVLSLKKITFSSEKVDDENAYQVEVGVSYEVDMNYPNKVLLTIVHENDKLVIVEVK